MLFAPAELDPFFRYMWIRHDEIAWGKVNMPPPYKIWWVDTDDAKLKRTEEILKGQAFGL